MNESFAIKGTLNLLLRGDTTIEQTEEIVNIWLKKTKKKAYTEGWLDGLRLPQRAEKDPLSVAEIEAIQTHLDRQKEGVK